MTSYLPIDGDKVRSIRKNQQKIGGEIASQAGISRSYLSKIETGQVEQVQADHVSNLAAALGVRPQDIIHETVMIEYRVDTASLSLDQIAVHVTELIREVHLRGHREGFEEGYRRGQEDERNRIAQSLLNQAQPDSKDNFPPPSK